MARYLKCKIKNNNAEDFTKEIDLSALHGIFIENDINIENSQLYVQWNGHVYQKNLLFLERNILFNKIKKTWKHIENQIFTENATQTNIADIKEVINLLLFFNHSLIEINNNEVQASIAESINSFKNCIFKITEMDDTILNTLTSNIIIIEDEPVSQYFHSYLRIFYLILSMERRSKVENFQITCESLIMDFIKLSQKVYEKHKHEILYIQPFVCLCVKHLWVYLLHNEDQLCSSFWITFNNCVKGQNEEFSIWLMRHLAQLQYYSTNKIFDSCDIEEDKVNIVLINKLLQMIVSNAPDEIKLLNVLKLLEPLLTELWIKYVHVDLYQILWDYFYKNLGNDHNIVPKDINGFTEKVNNILRNPKKIKFSYDCFLHLLHKHLTKHPLHWKKLQGRIYSRLPIQKINKFNNIALYNIALLFCTLADLKILEVLEKLNVILENISEEQKDMEFTWIIHVNLAIISLHQNQDIRKVVYTFQKLIEHVAGNREKFHLMKHFINGLGTIFDASENLDLSQDCLLGPWIVSYMLVCSHVDLCTLIELLINVLKKAECNGKWNHFKHSYLEYVLPTLKQISITSSIPQLGKLAGLILFNIPTMSMSIVSSFCNELVNIEVTKEFLTTILVDCDIRITGVNQESTLISAWCRICLLCTECNKDLCKKIFNLQSIRNIVLMEEKNYNEPLLDFIKTLHKQMSSQSQSFRMKELCELCFGNIDHWIQNYLTPMTSESQVLYLFTKISLLFYYCAPLLYQKSKSTCLLNRLITVLLLPTDVLMGKSPSLNILHVIEKTWHLFVEGIFKLDHTFDPYIERTLKDLIIRYIPHFSVINSPIVNILNNDNLSAYILEKITNTFLLRSGRSSEESTYKALKIINNILQDSYDLLKVKKIVQKMFSGILEVIMFNSQRTTALEIVKFLASSQWYTHIHNEIQLAIQNIAEKHLAFNTNNYFQLVDVLQKYMPEDIRSSFPHIRNQVLHVERMRGIGFDNTLRQALDKVESRFLL